MSMSGSIVTTLEIFNARSLRFNPRHPFSPAGWARFIDQVQQCGVGQLVPPVGDWQDAPPLHIRAKAQPTLPSRFGRLRWREARMYLENGPQSVARIANFP